MNKIAIFPFDKNSSVIARYCDMVTGYTLKELISPKGKILDGKDACVIDKGKEIGINISEDFSASIDNVDAVMFLDSKDVKNLQLYISYINEALKSGKKIIITAKLEKRLKQANLNIGNDYSVIGENRVKINEAEQIKYIDVPVISVFGMGECCNKFEIQLELRRKFLSKGYTVMQIGSKEYSELFGFENMPDFVSDSSLSLKKRILDLNNYVYDALLKKPVDLVIIGIPGGVAPLDNYFYNDFGEIPYIVANALKPDVSVLSTYFFYQVNEQFLSELREYMKHKYNAVVDYFHLSSSAYTVDSTDEIPELVYLRQDWKTVQEVINNKSFNQISVFNVFGDTKISVLDKICIELEQNVEVI